MLCSAEISGKVHMKSFKIYLFILEPLVGNDNVMGFNNREAKLAQRVREVEEQNQMLRHQLR